MPHQGVLVDVAARTHRGRRGVVSLLDDLVLGEGGLYFSGHFPDNARFKTFERWALPAQGWVIGRFGVHPGQRPMAEDWYVDLDAISIEGHLWRIEDRLLDLGIFEGRFYRVEDLDELADSLERGEVNAAEAAAALRSLDALCRALHRLDFSGARLLGEYAPGLPGGRLR